MNRCKRPGVARGSAGLLWLAFGLFAQPAAGEDLTAELVKQARARQEKVKSFEVKLKHVEVVSAGAIAKGNKAFPPKPKERTVLTSESRLIIQGNKLRDEGNNHHFYSDKEVRQVNRIIVSDAVGTQLFMPNGVAGDGQSRGIIQEDRTGPTASLAWPLLMAFRGLDPILATDDLRRLVPSDVTMPLMGIPCRRFDLHRSKDYKKSFWIDDFGLIRRTTSEINGQLSQQTEVRYERQYGFEFFPVSWTSVVHSRGGAGRIERTVEVVEAKINQPVAEAEFTILFPPGCTVYDQIARKEYVVQPDGGMVEKSQPNKELEPQSDKLSRYRGPIAVCLGAILVVVVAACLVRLRRGKQKANHTSK